MGKPLQRQHMEGTAGRILELLRRGPMTVDELTTALKLTGTGVRSQLAKLQHDDLIARHGTRRGPSKPAYTYSLTSHAELLFSLAYIPILTHLLHVLARQMTPGAFAATMRETGRSLMAGHPVPRGPLRQRVTNASSFLNELGGLTEVEEQSGLYLILSHGCPLAAATAEHPEACDALESLLSEFIGTQVTKCCDRYERLRCCFEVAEDSGRTAEAQRSHPQ
jgi:DeoR family suf operon transcriptional repressor